MLTRAAYLSTMRGMSDDTDLLDRVVAELERRKGSGLATIAEQCGMSYDTVLRIMRRKHDPGYSKVVTLARVLFQTAAA